MLTRKAILLSLFGHTLVVAVIFQSFAPDGGVGDPKVVVVAVDLATSTPMHGRDTAAKPSTEEAVQQHGPVMTRGIPRTIPRTGLPT
jgi:hypothetical protein